jgi:hypothetical protein
MISFEMIVSAADNSAGRPSEKGIGAEQPTESHCIQQSMVYDFPVSPQGT